MEALAVAFRRRQLATSVEPLRGRATADIVVVDSYDRRADAGFVDAIVVVAVDDLERDLAVDVVVDPSPGTPARFHERAEVALVGPRYALIGPGLPDQVTPPRQPVKHVLVTLGGHDPEGRAWKVATALAHARPDIELASTGGPVDVADRRGVSHVDTRDGLGAALAKADVVICAGGVTLLESLVLGRPTVVVVTAENQRRAADAVVAEGAAVAATPESAASVAASLIADDGRRTSLRRAAETLLDRSGPDRVADTVLERLRMAGT